jgi:hypothetical protein
MVIALWVVIGAMSGLLSRLAMPVPALTIGAALISALYTLFAYRCVALRRH